MPFHPGVKERRGGPQGEGRRTAGENKGVLKEGTKKGIAWRGCRRIEGNREASAPVVEREKHKKRIREKVDANPRTQIERKRNVLLGKKKRVIQCFRFRTKWWSR